MLLRLAEVGAAICCCLGKMERFARKYQGILGKRNSMIKQDTFWRMADIWCGRGDVCGHSGI